ncbi:MAG: hypothetical protein J5497_04095 [Selenomonadaceae bacterium]|nr:hypothetical protein [Selenomonadaceae bacterium]
MERWQNELETVPIGHMLSVQHELAQGGRQRARQLLDAYEERIAIICECHEVTPEDISAAWSSVLHMTDLMPVLKKRHDTEG